MKFWFVFLVWLFSIVEGVGLALIGFTWRTWQFYAIIIPVAIVIGLTSRAVDEGDSAPLQAESTPEHLPIEEADTTPALRN